MQILIFVICLTFGLLLTLVGLRNLIVSGFAVIFNLAVFSTALVDGVTEQLYNGTSLQTVTYDSYPALVLPALFVLISAIKIAKYR